MEKQKVSRKKEEKEERDKMKLLYTNPPIRKQRLAIRIVQPVKLVALTYWDKQKQSWKSSPPSTGWTLKTGGHNLRAQQQPPYRPLLASVPISNEMLPSIQPRPLACKSHPNSPDHQLQHLKACPLQLSSLGLCPLLSWQMKQKVPNLPAVWSCHEYRFSHRCSFCHWVKKKSIKIWLSHISFISTHQIYGSWPPSDHQLPAVSSKEPGPKSQPPPPTLGSAARPCPHRLPWTQHPPHGPNTRSPVPSCLHQDPYKPRRGVFATTTLAHFSPSFLPNHMIDELIKTRTNQIQPALCRLLSIQPCTLFRALDPGRWLCVFTSTATSIT